MAKHRMPVTHNRLLASLALGASCALWVGTMALTAPQPEATGQAHATAVQEDEPGWDCATMGNRLCGSQVRVWPKGGVEVGGSAAVCDTDASCAQYAWDHGWTFDEMTPESMVGDRSKPYGWAAMACWVEKVHTATPLKPGDAEVICDARGDQSKRPRTDTADIGETFGGLPSGDCGWIATYTAGYGFEFEPVGCN